MTIENPKGIAGLWLAFLIAFVAIFQIIFDLDSAIVAAINIALAALVAAVSETVRRIPTKKKLEARIQELETQLQGEVA